MSGAPLKRKLLRTSLVLFCLALPFVGWRVWRRWLADSQLAEVRRAGFPTNGEELNRWQPVVPDAENAALVLTQAFALRQSYPDSRSNLIHKFKLPVRQRLEPDQVDLIKGYVDLNLSALAKADEALKLPKSRYPIDFAYGMQTPLPHLGWLHNLALLNQYQAELSLLDQRSGDATRAITNILGLARTVENEPPLISQMVRWKLLSMAAFSVERCLNLSSNLTDTENLSARLAEAADVRSLATAFIGERAAFTPYFRTSPTDDPRLYPPKEEKSDGDEADSGSVLRQRDWGVLKVIGYNDMDLGQFLFVMKDVIALASNPPPENLEIGSRFARASASAKKKGLTFSAIIFRNYAGVPARENECIASLRLAAAALAVEQFRGKTGGLPDKLEDLKPAFLAEVPEDPFDGEPLRYRRLPKGYVLYSVGRDLVDDGGKEKPEKKSSSDSGYDITFVVERD